MPHEVRVLPHYALRLVTVAVADKQNLNHGSIKPPNGTFCRDLRTKVLPMSRTIEFNTLENSYQSW